MITLAGAGSLLGRTGRAGRGRGGDSGKSGSRGAAGGRRRGRRWGGGEGRRCSSRQPGLLTDLTRGQRGGSLQRSSEQTFLMTQLLRTEG